MINFRSTTGFTIIEIGVLVTVVAMLTIGAYLAWTKPEIRRNLPIAQDPKYISWQFNGEVWKASGKAPACEDPLVIASPTDVSKLNGKLWPGQVRGTDFKPHGGLSAAPESDNLISVSTVRDGYVQDASRYVSFGQIQYMIDFIDSCGVMIRYDHLATLTPDFQAIVDRLPEPKNEDSRSTRIMAKPWFAKSTLLATEVGIRAEKNVFFDLGVYDLRQPNAASKTELYKTDQLRIADKEQSFYSLCWFDLLPEPERAAINALPSRDSTDASASDYCN